jgi:5-formyltetrahydrofolate cyclo-ligase
MEKSILRKSIKTMRNSMSKDVVIDKSKKICACIKNCKWFLESKNIMIYISANNEVDLKELFLENPDKNFFAPVCIDKNNMICVPLYSYSDLKESKFKKNIFEPKVETEDLNDIPKLDLILVPGVAYDRNKNRIGYGAGYYDRFLEKLQYKPLLVGVCYELQLVENIFPDDNDVKMDYVATEKYVYI